MGFDDPPLDAKQLQKWDRMIRCGYEGESKYQRTSVGGNQQYELNHKNPCGNVAWRGTQMFRKLSRILVKEEIQPYKQQAASGVERGITPDTSVRDRINNSNIDELAL